MGQQYQDGWYVRHPGDGTGLQPWLIADGKAMRSDLTNADQGPGSYFAAEADETVWDAIRRQTPWLEGQTDTGPFVRMKRDAGQYYPRIARPLALATHTNLWAPNLPQEQRYLASAQNQLHSLVSELQSICRVVQPAPTTLSVYGHEIRNLLILSATEVEMHWRGILEANGNAAARFNTNHYVKLADPLKLRAFSVRFQPCPDIAPYAPFARWDASDPTGSLAWYSAYNGVKHNRDREFVRATLDNAFAAIAACVVLLVAQFGRLALTPELTRFVAVKEPDWPLEEMYLAPQSEGGWTPHPYAGLS
jgi:hypothetical protein